MNPSPTSSSIPIIEDSQQRLEKLRGRLQGIFHELHTIQSVIAVCAEAIANQGSDFDPEVVVLTRSGADNLCNQLYSLTDVIEQLGGRTEYTEARKRAAAQGGHAS
jgi:hypothetical protein